MYEKIRHRRWDNHLSQYVKTVQRNPASYDMYTGSQKERTQSQNKEHTLI